MSGVRMPLVPGAILDARYEVVRCLSAGGMGAVYEVIHRETRRRLALKVMHGDLATSAVLRRRFALEARVAAEVDSAHIVQIIDARLEDDVPTPYIVMELLRGSDLEEHLARRGRLHAADALVVLQQLGGALDRTHATDIVHRDLKPANLFLMLREDGVLHLKILDFGIAKVLSDAADSAARTGVLGTPLYMAPEQVAARPVTPAVDRYAVGQLAYSMLVGKAYWQDDIENGMPLHALLLRVLEGVPEPPSVRAARAGVLLPPAFDAWFARATAVHPAGRFPSCDEAVQALADALGMELPPPPRPSGVFFDVALDPSGPAAGARPGAPIPLSAGDRRSSPGSPTTDVPFADTAQSPAIGPAQSPAIVPEQPSLAFMATSPAPPVHPHRRLAGVIALAAGVAALLTMLLAGRPAPVPAEAPVGAAVAPALASSSTPGMSGDRAVGAPAVVPAAEPMASSPQAAVTFAHSTSEAPLPRDVPNSLPRDVRQSLPRDVRQSLPRKPPPTKTTLAGQKKPVSRESPIMVR